MSFLAEPERCPEVSTAVIILGYTTSQTKSFHEAVSTDPLQAMGESFAEFQENGGVGPDILQSIRVRMPEDKVGHGLPNSTERIRTVSQNAQNGQNSADPAPISIIGKYFSKGAESQGVIIVKT